MEQCFGRSAVSSHPRGWGFLKPGDVKPVKKTSWYYQTGQVGEYLAGRFINNTLYVYFSAETGNTSIHVSDTGKVVTIKGSAPGTGPTAFLAAISNYYEVEVSTYTRMVVNWPVNYQIENWEDYVLIT